MLAELKQNSHPLPGDAEFTHLLVLIPKSEALADDIPGRGALQAVLARKGLKPEELAESPVSVNLASGALASFAMIDDAQSAFERQAHVKKAVLSLLEERPKALHVAVLGKEEARRGMAELAMYCAWVNGSPLPVRKKKDGDKPLEKIMLHGFEGDFSEIRAAGVGNILARELTAMPPNELNPGSYREKITKLAAGRNWKHEEFGLDALLKMGAGAFCAVAQGSGIDDAAIVHLAYAPEHPAKSIALVGKGICFDTGGHNLKPARYMHGMHEDMNGSAVALGLLLAASEAKLDIGIDCWLAIAQNHISPQAYKQNDIVTALNGLSIEIVHTDAEGRMVLADALTLASRESPDLVIDFATLTGSMATALGNRYSGIFGNDEELLALAVDCGKKSGERLCSFPMDADYGKELESDFADIRQCTLEGDADHILAAHFLGKFVEEGISWLHVDLSASNCKGGLGSVGTDITGFGVKWGLEFLRAWLNR